MSLWLFLLLMMKFQSGRYEKISICKAMKLAAEGESFIIDEDVSTCPGGNHYCGFSEPFAGKQKRKLQKFLTKGEKLTVPLFVLRECEN